MCRVPDSSSPNAQATSWCVALPLSAPLRAGLAIPFIRKRLACSCHALLSDLNRSRCTSRSKSHLPLRQRVTVVISTAPFDGEESPHKLNYWLRRSDRPDVRSICRDVAQLSSN